MKSSCNFIFNKKSLIGILLGFFLLNIQFANAVVFQPADYLIAGDVGDSWDYVDQQTGNFTWTLEEITVGVNAGRMKLGNSTKWFVYDVVGGVITVYEDTGTPINPPLTFPASHDTDIVASVAGEDVAFVLLPSLTVQSVTYNDVLAVAWLDSNFPANIMNTALGLNAITASGVTDVDYYARDVGHIKFYGVAASTGANDGSGFELISYNPSSPSQSPSSPNNNDGGGGSMGFFILSALLAMRLKRLFC